MPRDLAALLVEEGAASAEAVEHARARQAELGGSLDTALLELGLVSEERLVPLLASAAGLPPAPEVAWAANDPRARRVFPSRVAERHGLAPFALDGRELSLVASSPVDVGLLDEISFMLSLHLTAHVGPEWRVRELIHRLYGSPLAPRFAALAAVAEAAPEEPAAPVAQEPGPPGPGDEEAAPGAAPEEGLGEADLGGGPADEPPRAPALAGFARDEAEPLEPLAAALAQAVEAADPSLFGEPEPAAAATEEQGGPPEAGPEGAEAPLEEEEEEEERPPPDRSAPPRWTHEAARAALAAARSRDEVVLAALRYARDFFEFAALFAVTRDAVVGHDALGAEEGARDLCRGVAIYADDPGLLRTVIEARSPYLGPVSREAPGTEEILGGLARGTPRTVLVFPVLLRDRPVCVLYADNGEAPASPRRLGDLLLLLAGVGAAFERVIRTHKRRRPRAAPPAPVTPAAPPAPAAPQPAPGERWATSEPLRAPAPEAPPADSPPPEPWTMVEPARAAPAPAAGEPEVDLEVEVQGAAAEPAAALPGASRGEPAPPPAGEPSPGALADLALSADPAVAAEACDALAARRRAAEIRPAAERLRRALLSGISARSAGAARALGALRDVDAVPLLVQALEMSDPPAAMAAAEALAAITLQRLGPDPRRWLAWWKENRGRGRADWLFSGLTSADRETRVAAAVELSSAAPPPVAYSVDMPSADREQAARAWAGWWSRSGQVL